MHSVTSRDTILQITLNDTAYHPHHPPPPGFAPRNMGCERATRFLKHLPYFKPKYAIPDPALFIPAISQTDMPARFSPGFGRCPNLGFASDSKPRGSPSRPGCWWLAGGQLSKAGGSGGCFVLPPQLSRSFQCQITLILTVLLGILLSC